MTRRRVLLLRSVAVVVALGVAVWALWPRTAISRANAAKIEDGMTLAEVEAILGGAPRDESTGVLDPDLKTVDGLGLTTREWRSDEVIVHVTLDHDGRVSSRTVLPVRRVDSQEPLFTRLRRLVGL